MPRFSANISMLFAERAWLDRPAAAAASGFAAIEIQFPYDRPAEDWRRAIEGAGLAVSVINLPVGDMLAGGPGLAATPGRRAEFREAVEAARDVAAALRPANVNVLPGYPERHGHARERCLETLAENLRVAADVMGGIGVGTVVEAVNTVDRPGFLLSTSEQALDVIDRAGHDNLALEHDLYHMDIMEGRPDPPARGDRAAYRPYPVRGQSRAARTRHGDHRLSGRIRRPRPARLSRLDGGRVHPEPNHGGDPGLDGDSGVSARPRRRQPIPLAIGGLRSNHGRADSSCAENRNSVASSP